MAGTCVLLKLSVRPQCLQRLAWMLVRIYATLSQMGNFNFDSRKGKTELGEHGQNQCEKPKALLTLQALTLVAVHRHTALAD